MFKTFLKLSLRSLIRYKNYTIINLLCLIMGISSFIMVMLYITDEMSYDRFYSNHKQIYRINQYFNVGGVGEKAASVPFPLGPLLIKKFPNEIVSTVRVFNNQISSRMMQANDKKFNENGLFFVDNNFFSMFNSLKFIYGNKQTAFKYPKSCVITKSTANKYFPGENPVGKTLIFESFLPLKVTGVIDDVPPQTHFKFNILVNFSSIARIIKYHENNWVWNPCWTYILISENTSKSDLELKIKTQITDTMKFDWPANFLYKLQKITDIHLKSHLDYEISKNSDIQNIYIILVTGFIILLIAGINFINLSTSYSSSRAKEIGMKKVLGEKKLHIVYQFLIESVLLSMISLLVSLSLVELILPYFNELIGKNIHFSDNFQIIPLITIIPLSIIIGLLAGLIPGIYFSRYEPAEVLRKRFSLKSSNAMGRKILVIFQFSLSSAIIIISIMTFGQNRFLKTADLGFKKENLLAISVYNKSIISNPDGFKNELLKIKGVTFVSRSDYIPGVDHNTHFYKVQGKRQKLEQFLPALIVDHDFVKTTGMKIIAGRDYISDDSIEVSTGILVNKEMTEYLGWTPKEALGKSFKSVFGNEKIIGVIDNFNVRPLNQPISPFIIDVSHIIMERSAFIKYFLVRIDDNANAENVLKEIESVWNKTTGNRPFESIFVEQAINNLYRDENKLGKIYAILSIISLIIAGLGLFGLTAYIVQQKTKEIGIRKILGASMKNILVLLSREFVLLTFYSNMIAWPAAYFFMKYQLDNFAYSIKISALPFIITLLITTALTFTITLQKALKIANSNPSKSLRYE